ncbi:MAG: hypothetical protein K2X55_12010 [Burkholderiaceae bacterium]|nr:hypothetical protein [Burkholderiaceae bacterium]
MVMSPQSTEALERRVRELEAALEGAVAYMKRLPLVPTTLDEVRRAEKVLLQVAPPAVLRGERHYSSGVMVVRAELIGDVLTLTSGDVDNLPPEMAEKYKLSFYEKCKNGYQVKLAPVVGPKILS